jgi:Na+/melibiose symporter-like transporter
MFFTGIISSVLGLFIFNSLEESPLWKQLAADKAARAAEARRHAPVEIATSPLRTIFSPPYRNILLVNLLITIGGGSAYYLTSGYLPTFLKVVTKAPNNSAATILMLSSLAVVIVSIAVGHLSSLIGRKRTFLLVGVIQLIAMPALYLMLPDAPTLTVTGVYVVLLSSLGCMGFAPILIFLNERFPTSVRATGTGLSWNIGFALGGMMPTAVSLVAQSPAELPVTLAAFVAFISAVFLIGAAIVPETTSRLSEIRPQGAA